MGVENNCTARRPMHELVRGLFLCSVAAAIIALTSGQLSAQTKSPSSVLLYTSVPQELATQFADAFTKRRPDIKVEIYRGISLEVGAILVGERGRGHTRADLLARP